MKKPSSSCSKAVVLLAALAALTTSITADSLWRDNQVRSMVADKRARSVGDIITILVQESNTASKDNKTQTSKSSGIDASIDSFFYAPGASKLLTKNGQLPALEVNGAQNFSGGGSISNSERITSRVAARVTDVLPNGHLVIEGMREIAFAGETQQAVLRGVVRSEDVTANNTVFSYNIADASIRYISKGAISDNQKKGWFTRVWDKVTPF